MRMGEWILNGSRRGCLRPCSCVTFPAMNKDTLIPNEQNPLIWINPERMGWAPCFYGTRLPVNSLFENPASQKKCVDRGSSPRKATKRVMRRRNSQKTPQMAAGYLRHAV